MTDHARSKGRARKNVGLYTDTQTLPGVKLYRRNFIVREAVRTSLKIANSTQTIEGSSDAGPVINTEHGTIGDTKDFAQLTGLPVNYPVSTTSPLALLSTVPGAQQDANAC
jgi:hypothetical protein